MSSTPGPLSWLRSLASRRVERPQSYDRLQRSVGSRRLWTAFVAEYLLPRPGMRILDLGCGTAEVLAFLPQVDYLGVDLHPPYVQAAAARSGHRARFRIADAATLQGQGERFDAVLLLGLLHHLDDVQAARAVATAAALLAPDGRVLTLDGCRTEGQTWLSRALLRVDRGVHIRDRSGYLALLEPQVEVQRAELREDLIRLPYTHLVTVSRAPEWSLSRAPRPDFEV